MILYYFHLLCLVAAYADVLENKATFSLIFEKDFLMPCSQKFIISLGKLSTEELDYTSNNYF